MDRWLNKRKNSDNEEVPSGSRTDNLQKKHRKYNNDYLSMGFTYVDQPHEQQPQCVLCYEVLSNEAMKPSKLRRHFETKHKELVSKSIDFFKNKEHELRASKKIIKKVATGCNNENAVKASFEVAFLIAKTGKSHTIAEELILPAAKMVVSTMISEKAAKDLSLIALSNDTIKKRIDCMSANMKEELIKRVRESCYFSLQLDESTDIVNNSYLLCYVRYEYETAILEDLLFVSSLIHTTSEEVFNKVNEFIRSNGIDWQKCVGISTDGARAMSGKLTGLATRIRNINPSVTWYHCCIHREALAVKKMPNELKEALDEAVKIVNFIKARSLNSRLFEQLCKAMDSEHQQLLLHTEVRWLSRGKVLSRFFELRNEINIFFTEHSPAHLLSERLNNFSWLCKLAYLSDIFSYLNTLSLSLQGVNITIFQIEDKIEAMLKKLELWSHRLSNQNYDPFENLKCFLETTEEKLSNENLQAFTQHMKDLRCSFRDYFPEPDTNKNWIRDPFSINIHELEGLTSVEENSLIEISTDGAMKLEFKQITLPNFWLKVRNDHQQLSTKALKILMPFPTTYLCEKAFSSLVYVKNKYRNRLKNVESELRIQLSNIAPNINKLVNNIQHQPSH